jgi:hypothetical protein
VVADENGGEEDSRRGEHRRHVCRRGLPELATPLDLDPFDEPGGRGERRGAEAHHERDPPGVSCLPLHEVRHVEDRRDGGEGIGADREVGQRRMEGMSGQPFDEIRELQGQLPPTPAVSTRVISAAHFIETPLLRHLSATL